MLLKAISNIATGFGIDMKHVIIVTDKASNIVAVFKDHSRLLCFAHCLNLVIADTLTAGDDDFQALLGNCKTFVHYFRHTGLQRKLDKTIK